MNANIISKYHVLFIGLIALISFSHSSAMQDGDSRNAARQLTSGKKAAVLLMGILALTLPQEANGYDFCYHRRNGECVYRDFWGRYYMWDQQTVVQKVFLPVCNGNARCTAERLIKKYDDGTVGLFFDPSPMQTDEWKCECENSYRKEKKVQRFEQKPEQRSYNATGPKRDKFQTPRLTRRNETRGQRGGRKGR